MTKVWISKSVFLQGIMWKFNLRGSGPACRKIVQELNLRKSHLNHVEFHENEEDVGQEDALYEDVGGASVQHQSNDQAHQISLQSKTTTSRWSKYL